MSLGQKIFSDLFLHVLKGTLSVTQVILKKLVKVFPGGVCAVNALDLTVSEGELLVLVGPSGCGKSTTLRLIAGLEEATSGTLWIGTREATMLSPAERNVAMVFQNHALYPHLNVRDNLSFGLKIQKVAKPEIARRLEEVVKSLALETRLTHFPSELSGGERQRVALGRAIIRQPDIFLLDEPLSSLDARLRVEMRAEIVKLHQRLKATMIYVTHDQTEAMTLGDRLVVMDQGEIQQVGTPLEIYQNPVNRFVAKFIGSPPMNIFCGSVVGDAFTASADVSLTIKLPKNSSLNRRNMPKAATVWCGIRPEHLLTEEGVGFFLTNVRLERVESLGYETTGYFQLAGVACAVRFLGTTSYQIGSEIPLWYKSESLHFFET